MSCPLFFTAVVIVTFVIILIYICILLSGIRMIIVSGMYGWE